ncbi:chromate transporter [uncultured Alsobacter sp.]|uniref:chromate transporter n=1 Tax=uncultured Alsobacter sp. TaxID=1748258 RepID=UPI0025DD716F|nr:chromate transporter [uncultured Alsobacter sp.]
MTAASPTEPAPEAPGVASLFTSFLMLGLTGFGGVLPMARHMVVEKRRWLTGAEFSDLLGLCQFLPGGNVINVAVAIGMRFRGPAGAAAALIGLIAAPTAIAIALGSVYARYGEDPAVQHAFAGLASAAAGLIVATAAKIALPLKGKPVAIAVAGVCFGAIAILRLPLLPTLLVIAPVSIALAWRMRR